MLAYPECSASVVYGMYDLFMSTGTEWGVILEGKAGPRLMRPMLVSAHPGPVQVSNAVDVSPHSTLADCPPVDIVCVPEVNLPPGEPLEERFAAEGFLEVLLDELAHLHELGEHQRAVADLVDFLQHLGEPRELAGAFVQRGAFAQVLARVVADL
ncbi:MAG: hypothetical protein HC809_17350, partial [Gammaproteobacteria bacterium]|nr:hypothetical protein [Gammaproteobacteria bacterium]